MSTWIARTAGAGLLIVVGMAVGTWASTSHYRPLLDYQQDKAATCASARDNLAGLAQEQSKALGDLAIAAQSRQTETEQAVSEAKAAADLDYAASNRLQQEHIGGDQCAAATTIIDTELGL